MREICFAEVKALQAQVQRSQCSVCAARSQCPHISGQVLQISTVAVGGCRLGVKVGS
jgi:hypothetical protein